MGDGILDEQKLQRVADAAPEFEDKHGALTTIGRSTVADLQQWARETAPSFGGWERLEAWDAAGRPGGLEDVLGIDEEQGEALLAYRDEVAAGPWGNTLVAGQAHDKLVELGLVVRVEGEDEGGLVFYNVVTPFGRVVTRKAAP